MPTRSLVRLARLIVFAPAAILAFSTPAQANQYLESFDNGTAELVSVSLGQGAFYCGNYRDAYGTSGPSICLFNTSSPTTFVFPQNVAVQGFQFVAGAKNGTTQLTVNYSDGTTEDKPIDGSCCVATVQVVANAGKTIVSFSIPADYDLWLFDSLAWVGSSPAPTTTSVETTLPTSTVEQTSSTSSTSTSSSTVPTTMPPPPPDTQPTAETVSSTLPPETTVVPSTTASPTTTVSPTTSVAPSTTTLPESTTIPTPTTTPPSTLPEPPGSVPQDDSPVLVPETALAEQPSANAPDEVKAQFEAQVDIFSGEYDDYVPLGSTITVAQRRTVVAATAVFIIMMPAPSTMRRRP